MNKKVLEIENKMMKEHGITLYTASLIVALSEKERQQSEDECVAIRIQEAAKRGSSPRGETLP